jgi:hypothetical protein
VRALFKRGGVGPIRVRSVLMYTIKILQRLIDRGTHNSIFAFVLLILKTISREPSFGQRPSRLRPRPSLATRAENQRPASRPRSSSQPRLATRLKLRPERKTSRNQTIKEHGARTVRTHFFFTAPPLSRSHLSPDFRPTSSNPGCARGVEQTPNRRAVQATFSQNPKLFCLVRSFEKATSAASRRRALGKTLRSQRGRVSRSGH